MDYKPAEMELSAAFPYMFQLPPTHPLTPFEHILSDYNKAMASSDLEQTSQSSYNRAVGTFHNGFFHLHTYDGENLARADHLSNCTSIYKNNNLCTRLQWPALIYLQTSQHPFAYLYSDFMRWGSIL